MNNIELEKMHNIEKIGKNRKKLLELEKTGNYVFHGSPNILENLDPRQAENKNKETGQMEKHGIPAVCGTVLADQAIFRSLVNENLGSKNAETKFGSNEQGVLHFSATQNLIDIARSSVGKVYIFDKNKFEHFEGNEWRSTEPVSPDGIIEVTFEDLPENIEII